MQRVGWKMCLGCENMCITVLKDQATMGDAFLTCLEVCLWRISLCLDVQKFSKDVTVPGRVRGQCVPGEPNFDKRHSLHCEEGWDSQAEMGG